MVSLMSLVSSFYYVFPWVYGKRKTMINLDNAQNENFATRIDIVCEIFFAMHILKNFMTDFPQENSR